MYDWMYLDSMEREVVEKHRDMKTGGKEVLTIFIAPRPDIMKKLKDDGVAGITFELKSGEMVSVTKERI